MPPARDLTERAIGLAIAVHRGAGPGLLDAVDEACLCHGLARGGLAFERRVRVPVSCKGVQFEEGFRADVLVDRRLLLDITAVATLVSRRANIVIMFTALRAPDGESLPFRSGGIRKRRTARTVSVATYHRTLLSISGGWHEPPGATRWSFLASVLKTCGTASPRRNRRAGRRRAVSSTNRLRSCNSLQARSRARSG